MSLTTVNTAITTSGQRLQRADGAVTKIVATAPASASACSKRHAATRLARLEFERSGRRGSHRPVSSATEAVYFKCVQSSLDISQGASRKAPIPSLSKRKPGRSAATNPPGNNTNQPAAVVHENSFSRAKTRGVGRFVHDGRTPYQTPRGAQLPAAVLSGLPGPTAKPIRGFAFCHLDIRPVDLSCLKMASEPSTAQIQADLPS